MPRASRRVAVTAWAGGRLVHDMHPESGEASDHCRNSCVEVVGLPVERQTAGGAREPECQAQREVEAASFRVHAQSSSAAAGLPPPLSSQPTPAKGMCGTQHAQGMAVAVAVAVGEVGSGRAWVEGYPARECGVQCRDAVGIAGVAGAGHDRVHPPEEEAVAAQRNVQQVEEDMAGRTVLGRCGVVDVAGVVEMGEAPKGEAAGVEMLE